MKLEFYEIEKSFGTKKVLDKISFVAEGGKAFGLLGRNGAGKTTSIRILMDVFPADSGKVLLDGEKINYDKIGMGYLPEERGLYPKKIVLEQLCYFAELKGLSKKEAVASVDFWLNRLGMTEYRNKKLETLSKGNQQKIQLITAVAHNPEIVILDEPFSGLDPVNAMLLKDVVKELIANGKIVLFSSHQMNYIEEFCDSIAILNNGKVALSGDLKDIKRSFVRNKLVVFALDDSKIKADFPSAYEDGKGGLIVPMENPADKQKVMQQIASNYEIDGISVYEPSLNDIFVSVCGEKEDKQ